ncbi:hypothetical protein DFJ58DRAFT_847535 [Suillus subalutaceus]|uniref:uncharacterized protein n=1 Tax=Suillus subalutaceus TaxID=48586 RepID=UPI001B879840|nr:uncharacterized protein DFJ58DRAFT_847535 [Suillus subalutaceus]KAG1834945.1 hypothetical protein DFJ58DRAFT_847535 [Suillus subalutaceus]
MVMIARELPEDRPVSQAWAKSAFTVSSLNFEMKQTRRPINDHSANFGHPNFSPSYSTEFDNKSPYPKAWSGQLSCLVSISFSSSAIAAASVLLIFLEIKISRMSLNPGPFTIKEHELITVDPLPKTLLALFYRHLSTIDHGFGGCDFCLHNLIGFSTGGITQRFLVSPPHDLACDSRLCFHKRILVTFLLVTYLCKFFGNHIPCADKTAVWECLVTFDWAQFAYALGRSYLTVVLSLVVQIHWVATSHAFLTLIKIRAMVNVIVGFVFYFLRYLVFSMHATTFVTRIMTSESTFNATAYKEYSPIFIPTAFVMFYVSKFGIKQNGHSGHKQTFILAL